MWKHTVLPITVSVLIVFLAGIDLPAGADPQKQGEVVVHEWGTFTTVAGSDGQAVQWLPLGGPTDLPCFVDYFKNRLRKDFPAGYGAPLDYETARSGLKGTVRMETPVLYFYASHQAEVHVTVRFSQGLFTEWYPSAQVNQVPFYENLFSTAKNIQSTIAWPNVKVLPGTRPVLPVGEGPSHYYAARETDAAPIQINGQDEKFLFYRGVGGFSVPISATLVEDGRILVRNLADAPIPAVGLFTNYGGKIGYRAYGVVRHQAMLDAPSLESNLSTVRQDLEQRLGAQGLYPREARAMVNTWSDSWFEEGTRIFYIVPAPAIDAILPLSVEPKPVEVARVFVGRMEVIAPAGIAAVEEAIAKKDQVRLAQYGRLLGPIGDRILTKRTAPGEKAKIISLLNSTFKSYVARAGGCS